MSHHRLPQGAIPLLCSAVLSGPGLAAVATLGLFAFCVGGCGSDAHIKVNPPPRDAPPLIVGIVADTLDAGKGRLSEQRLIRQLGVRWIREELRWPVVEPEPGVFRWSSFDRLLTTATRSGLHVLPLLIGTPSWAGPATLALPNDPQQFGAFAAAASARYGPGGTFWRENPRLDRRLAPQWFELWNEPYEPHFSQTGVDPARYARMVAAATTAGRAANPRTRWLMAVDYRYGSTATGDWIAALYAAQPQLNRSFDGVAVHPYTNYSASAGATVASLEDRFDRVGAIWTELNDHGAGSKAIWITELGWSTCALRPDCVSTHDQAQYLADAFARVRSTYKYVVKALFVYDLGDSRGTNPDDREAHFGLLNPGGKPKPAWRVLQLEAKYARQ